jgi:hypothetical protein
VSIINAVRVGDLRSADTIRFYDGYRREEVTAVVAKLLRGGSWITVYYGTRRSGGDHYVGHRRYSARHLVELVRRPWPNESSDSEMLDHVQTEMEAALGADEDLWPMEPGSATNEMLWNVLEALQSYLHGIPNEDVSGYGGTS